MRISRLTILALAALLTAGPAALAQDNPQPADEPVVTPVQPEAVDGQAAEPAGAAGESAESAEGSDGEQEPGQPPAKGPFGSNYIFLIMAAGLVLIWVFSSRSRKKQAKARQDMLAGLSKGDKVTTIGGIVGTVMDVREDEVTVKVDEGSNVKMRVARWAVRGVGEEAKTQAPDEQK